MPLAKILTLACLFLSGLPAPAASALPARALGCNGCGGSGGSNSASGGSCGGFVSIDVTVTPGKCRWLFNPDSWSLKCNQSTGCSVTVERSWGGLGSGTTLDFCITLDGETLCIAPKPVVDASGGGSSTIASPPMTCGEQPRVYSIGNPACGLSTSATSTCAQCVGSVPGG
ncbi:MAG: hypothetical protein HOP15_02035 [Planctomycetes bacterium]|nr:hypothetical protein [Planctomycetota bacterium]